MKDQLAEKNSELSTLHSLLLSLQHQLQRSKTKETFFREQAQLFGACHSVRRRESARSEESDPQLLLHNSELTAILDYQKPKLSIMQAENVCLTSALDDLITSSVSQSADSVVMLEQTVLFCCGHQTILDNIVLADDQFFPLFRLFRFRRFKTPKP